jgi:isoleucyl-tRNA synthetase
MAPFTPFLAEEMYRNLTDDESVHLAEWPVADDGLIDKKLNEDMNLARFIVSVGLQTRAENKIKVRQPLKSVSARPLGFELEEIVKEELNVKEYDSGDYNEKDGYLNMLDLTITPELKLEGEAREIIRAIQEGRKKAEFNVEDRIVLGYQGMERVFNGAPEKGLKGFEEEIAKEVLATEVKNEKMDDTDYEGTLDLDGEAFVFQLKRV